MWVCWVQASRIRQSGVIAKSVRRTGAAVFGSLEGARDLSILFWFCCFVLWSLHLKCICGGFRGSILGFPHFGKLPSVCVRENVHGVGMQVSISLCISIYIYIVYMHVYLTILRLYNLRNGNRVCVCLGYRVCRTGCGFEVYRALPSC